MAHVLACFIVHVDQLSKAMQAEVAAGRTPFGPAIIERQDDESLVVRWKTQDGRAHELQIPRPEPGCLTSGGAGAYFRQMHMRMML